MSEVLEAKEAFNEWFFGENGIEYKFKTDGENSWENYSIDDDGLNLFKNGNVMFRLKLKTITINGIEVPAPFEPKEGDVYWYLTDAFVGGYEKYTNNISVPISIGAWRTEDEIKQVVAALRIILKGGLVK